MRSVAWTKRVRGARWFELVGRVGSGDAAFRIGEGLEDFSPPGSGELISFDNDAPFAYVNNHGRLVVEITRL
jgi:hypothetical protein